MFSRLSQFFTAINRILELAGLIEERNNENLNRFLKTSMFKILRAAGLTNVAPSALRSLLPLYRAIKTSARLSYCNCFTSVSLADVRFSTKESPELPVFASLILIITKIIPRLILPLLQKEREGFILDNKIGVTVISKIKELFSVIIMQQTWGFNVININSSLCIEVTSANPRAINVNVIFNNRWLSAKRYNNIVVISKWRRYE